MRTLFAALVILAGGLAPTWAESTWEGSWDLHRDLHDQELFRTFSSDYASGALSPEPGELDSLLTPEEREIVRGHEAEVPRSDWLEFWRARGSRSDPRDRFLIAMKLHFADEYGPELEWRLKLKQLYLKEAITSLGTALQADWATATEKRVFAYLRAELLRCAGRVEEARTAFREVMASERKRDADPEMAWLIEWAEEQALVNDASAMKASELAACLLPEMPKPDWNAAKSAPGWTKHHVALKELAERARLRDPEALDVLWKALDRKPARLLAMGETLDRQDFQWLGLRDAGDQWRKWCDETSEMGKRRDFTAFGAAAGEEPYLGSLAPLFYDNYVSKESRKTIVAPAIAKALAGGKDSLPVIGDLTPEGLVDCLLRYAYHQPPEQRFGTMRLVFRSLKQCGNDPHLGCILEVWTDELAAVRDQDGQLKQELEGEWKSSLWKAFCSYLAGVPDAAETLRQHPALVPVKGTSHTPLIHTVNELFQRRGEQVK